jgi:hypothetical protein
MKPEKTFFLALSFRKAMAESRFSAFDTFDTSSPSTFLKIKKALGSWKTKGFDV